LLVRTFYWYIGKALEIKAYKTTVSETAQKGPASKGKPVTAKVGLDKINNSTTNVALPGSYPATLKQEKDSIRNYPVHNKTGCLPGSYPGLYQLQHQISSPAPNTKNTPKVIIKYQKSQTSPKIDECSSRKAQNSKNDGKLILDYYCFD